MKRCFYIFAFFILAACTKQNHAIDWYIEHDAEREARVKECNNDPAEEVRQGSDCVNAQRATGLIGMYGGKSRALTALKNQ